MGIKAKLFWAYAKDHSEAESIRFALSLFGMDADTDEDTGWRTTESGKHYHIDPEGNVDKGPKAMVGGNVNEPETWDNGSNSSRSGRNRLGSFFPFVSLAKKAQEHRDSYDDWVSSLTEEETRKLDDNYVFATWDLPDSEKEGPSEYFERIHRMLAAQADKNAKAVNKPVDGKDLSGDYEWKGKEYAYTDPKYGQVIDTAIEDVIVKQGFDGVPKMVSKEEFDKIINDNPDAPVMMRTYSAPDAQTLTAYDDMLESGEWYVDCGVGGCKYGQGMYTAAVERKKPNTVNSGQIKLTPTGKGSVEYKTGMIVQEDDGTFWKFGASEPASKEVLDSVKPGEYVAMQLGEYGSTMVLRCTEPGKFYNDKLKWFGNGDGVDTDRLLGINATIASAEKVDESEVGKSDDNSIALQQMRMYVDLNKKRCYEDLVGQYRSELRKMSLNTTGDGAVIPLSKPMPDVINARTDAGYVFFKINDTGGKPIDQEGIAHLKPGCYVLSYDHSSAEGARSLNMIWVNRYREAQFVSGGNHSPVSGFANIADRNPVIHECSDITPPYPSKSDVKTSVRQMTLDPSAKMVAYEELEEIEDGYIASDKHTKIMNNAVEEVTAEQKIDPNSDTALLAKVFLGVKVDPRDWSKAMDIAYGYAKSSDGDQETVKEKAERIRDEVTKRTNETFRRENERIEKLHELYENTGYDLGVVAAILGYDAIKCSNYGNTIVVLNRSKLILCKDKVDVPKEGVS